MSANTQTNTVIVAQEKKEKKPTLSAKYSKFLIFGYGFVKSLEAQGALNAEGVEAAFEELKLMSSVEDQTQLYENLLTQSKESGKAMRKFITLRNKPPKAPRAKKPRAKKGATEPATAAPETPPAAGAAETPPALKVKAPRVKKATLVENDSEFDLIGQIVAAANTVEAAPTKTKEEKEAEKVAAKAAKEAAKVAAKEAKVAEKEAKVAKKVAEKEAKEAKKVTEKEAKAAKAAAKAVGTTANIPKVEEEEEEEVVEEEEIQTTEVVVDGKTYLVDDENNVYSVPTHEQVGTFNTETQTISLDL